MDLTLQFEDVDQAFQSLSLYPTESMQLKLKAISCASQGEHKLLKDLQELAVI